MGSDATSKKKIVIFVVSAVVFVLLAGSGTWLVVSHMRNSSPFSKKIIASVSFPLYYPDPLPAGYLLDKQSVGSDGTTASYTFAQTKTKKAVTVTMQATPATFDASKIIGSNPIPTKITPVGTLYNLSVGGSSKYMLTTGKTLIFITCPTTIDGKTITDITSGLKEITPK